MIILLLIQVVLIGLNAVFASAEIAVLSVNELRLEKLSEQGNKRAKRLLSLTGNPAKFLATIQVAITLSGFLGSAFAAENFSGSLAGFLVRVGIGIPRDTLETISVILITLILSYFTLIFGELVPKRVAMKKSEELAMAQSGLICTISGLFTPLVWLLSVSTDGVLRLMGIDPEEGEDSVSEEEIRMMVDAGSEKGAIDHEEKEFIQNVFEFDDLMVGEIATHRKDVVFLRMEDDDETWDTAICGSRHTLYPVYEESPDHVIGILNAKDYFRLRRKERAAIMAEAVKPAYFVPESIKADVLFRNMKKGRITMAVVLDEYGGMVGVITQNDLIEQLVGELIDDEEETAEQEPCVEKISECEWAVHGNMNLEDMAEEMGIELEDDQFDTFTGLMFDSLALIPMDGKQELHLRVGCLDVLITEVKQHQISEAVVRLSEEGQKQKKSCDR